MVCNPAFLTSSLLTMLYDLSPSKHQNDANNQADARVYAEPAEHVGEVFADGADRKMQRLGDLFVHQTLQYELHDLFLSRRQFYRRCNLIPFL
jgi:hypothetical protein